jgi:hypothetical protein
VRAQSVALLLCLPGAATAGAWTQPEGATYLKLAVSYLRTTEEFNHEGQRLALLEEDPGFVDAAFRDASLTAYGEHGLRDDLTLVAQLPFKALRTERTSLVGGGLLRRPEARNTVGPADLTLSLRYRLRLRPVVALQGGLKMPLGYRDRPRNDGAALGTGALDVEGHLLAGRSLHPHPAYITASIGYRRRGGRLHDEIPFAIEGGWSRGRLQLTLAARGIRSTTTPPDIFGDPVVTPLPGGGGALPDLVVGDQHILQLVPTLGWDLSRDLALQVELTRTVAATNAISGTALGLGIVLER